MLFTELQIDKADNNHRFISEYDNYQQVYLGSEAKQLESIDFVKSPKQKLELLYEIIISIKCQIFLT